MFLASTSDIIRIVTGSAVTTIGVEAAWVDNDSGTYTPGRTNTAITGATTTTVVASPSGSTVRNVKTLQITNNHATSSCVITIQHYDGTTSIDIEKITLYAGEQFCMAEDGEWRHLTAAGGEYCFIDSSVTPNLGISGTIVETYPRQLCIETNVTAPVSGALYIQGVFLKAGQLVSNISFFSATTAASSPTNQFFALYSRRLQLLARSANDTTTAWAANTIKTLAMTAPYLVQASDMYYIGYMVTASTVPTLKGVTITSGTLHIFPALLKGTSDGSLTTALPDPCTLPTSAGTPIYWAAIT